MDLQEIREELDRIDGRMASLFQERMKLCKEVAEFKRKSGKPVYDGEREKEKLTAVTDAAVTGFLKQGLSELFIQIMTISRRYQYKILAEGGGHAKTDFQVVKELPLQAAKVVYQGVEGAYSHAAAMGYFGRTADFYHVRFFEDAMKEVAEGRADYAVLPIENSSAGSVTDNYDLLIKYHNTIVAETFLPVRHCLLGLPGAEHGLINTVFSHPQALLQSSVYLNGHREWKQISVENTAAAAKKVVEDNDPRQAAIASEAAGKLYGLKALDTDINYNKNNTTRFLILSKESIYREGAEKITISFELPHKSGSLYNMLGNFIFNDVNLRMIESRPIPGRNWEYRFFADIEGNLSDASIQNALKGISEEAANMRILGNY